MTMQMPDISDFFAALDKTETSPEGRRLLERLGVSAKALEPDPLDKLGRRLYEDLNTGFHLGYADEGKLRNIPYHDVGEGPWVLIHYFFMSGIADNGRYPGPLPYGVTFDMSRADLAKLLGPPATSNAMVEAWPKDGQRLAVNFDPKSGAIKTVGIRVPAK